MSILKKAGLDCFNFLLGICLAGASSGMKEKLARRDAERGRNSLQWFTADETAVVEALAAIIVPSDEETPGIEDVSVFGPPAIVALDNLVATSSNRQQLYSRGLLSFDAWALKERGRKFADIPTEDQIALLTAAQHIHEGWTAGGSSMIKAWRRLRAATKARHGSLFAAQLYPQIIDDCFQVFYTSRVSWVWLDYDGPPMDKGYANLLEPR